MTGGAGPSEVRLALFRVAGEHVEERVRIAMSRSVSLHMEPRHEIGNLRLREVRLRHPLIGASVAQHGRDENALLIVEHHQGTDEVGRARSAASGRAVAARAVGGVELGATIYGGGIF